MESAPIDPPSDEHVLSGELLKSQHAGVRRLPHCAQITKRLISEGGVRGARDRRPGQQRKRDEMRRDDREKRGSGHYLEYELQIVCGQRQSLPDVWIFLFQFQSFENPPGIFHLPPPLLNQD